MKATVLAAVLLASTALAQGPRLAVERQIAKYVAAMQRKDAAGVAAIMTPDFVAIDRLGQTTPQAEVLARLRTLFARAKTIGSSCVIRSFKASGSEVRLTAANVLALEVPATPKKVSRIRVESVTEEVWTPAKGVYRIRSSKTVSERTTLDGKVIGGQGRPIN